MSSRVPGSAALACILTIALMLSGCTGGAASVVHSETRLRSDSLVERAIRHDGKGDTDEALQLLEEALDASSSIEDLTARSRILINISRINRRQGNPVAAQQSIGLALAACPGCPHYAEAAQEQGLVLLAAGDLRQALAWAEKAVAGERGGAKGRRLNLVARIRLEQHDTAAAGETAQAALSANREAGDAEEEANSLRVLGSVARAGGEQQKSLELLNGALEIDKRIGASAKIAADLDQLALTARAMGDENGAAGFRQRAAAVREAASRRNVRAQGTSHPPSAITSPSSKP